jgi:hypothetical protein
LVSPSEFSMEWPSAISWSSGTDLRFSSAMFTDVAATATEVADPIREWWGVLRDERSRGAVVAEAKGGKGVAMARRKPERRRGQAALRAIAHGRRTMRRKCA